MKGLGNLVKNELIKTGKAVYFKVFVILILVVSIALPTGYFINDKLKRKEKTIRHTGRMNIITWMKTPLPF